MRKRYWVLGMKLVAVAALVALFAATPGQAQTRKFLPTLSLQKWLGGPTDVLNRDTIYVSEAGPGEKRFLLVPIFIKNCLDTVTTVTGLTAEPIYSFRFKLQYNRALLRAVGVQKRGPLPTDTAVLAEHFNLSWDIDQDAKYKLSTTGASSANGERIMVTGSSSLPLPMSPLRPGGQGCQFRDTTVFMYVLFEVVGSAQGGTVGANTDQLIMTLDSLKWNTYEPANVTQRMLDRDFAQFQAGVAPTRILPLSYPNKYGASFISITARPRIDLLPQPTAVRQINNDESLYELTRPMQTQFARGGYIFRNLLLINGVAGARLRYLTVETDQPWLRIDTMDKENVGPGGTSPPGVRGMLIRRVTGQLNFNVVANTSFLPTQDGSDYPLPGIYTGYVTIRGDEPSNSATRLKVVLIVNRNPLEPQLDATTESTNPRGIRLMVRNSAPAPSADTTYLTFGTGLNATDQVDSVFGELEADGPMVRDRFGARFYPPAVVAQNPNFNGLVDGRGYGGNLPPEPTNESVNPTSIDIRNYAADTTLIYCVRFDAGSPLNYPFIVEYNVSDFPQDATLIIKDNIFGPKFSTDMRQTTDLGQGRRAFFIRDPNIREFCIEYTLPAVVQFPEIGRGWNFVSLPVKPSDVRSNFVFPNAVAGPIYFNQNIYDNADTVRPGVGYFIKYGQIQDRTVGGSPVKSITRNATPPVEVKLFEGWNTVGALYVPTFVDYMRFTSRGGLGSPVRTGEVYRYITDRGYEQTSVITPGFGYWIKVDRDGYYELYAPPTQLIKHGNPGVNDEYKVLNQLQIADNAQRVGTLYFGENTTVNEGRFELPPVPPTQMFDARFSNNGFVSSQDAESDGHVVRFQGVTYPVALTVGRADADYIVTDAVTGEVLGTFTRGQAGSVRITNPLTKSVRISTVAANAIELGDAFPNPAVGKVSFDFAVPTEEHVSIGLYSTLGQRVRTLFEGSAQGRQTVEFTTDGLPAGVYYYRMTVGEGKTMVRRITVAK